MIRQRSAVIWRPSRRNVKTSSLWVWTAHRTWFLPSRIPDSLIAASAAQDPYTMSGKAVEIGYDIMNGKKPEQALTLIPVELITKENVDQYKGWTK